MANISKGVGTLRTSMLIYTIGIVALLIAILTGAGSLLGLSYATSSVTSLGSASGLLLTAGIAIIGGVLLIIALIMALLGIVELKNADKRYSIGYYGVIVQLVGAVLAIILAVVGFSVISIFGYLLILIGAIMIMIMFWRLGTAYNDTLIKVGGILYLIVAPLGAILLYFGLAKVK